jgi:hypothetical protein
MLPKQKKVWFFLGMVLLLSSACADPPPKAALQQPAGMTEVGSTTPTTILEPTASQNIPPSPTVKVSPQETPTQFPQVSETLPPVIPTHTPLALESWKDLPVIPAVSQRTVQIYQKGQELGRDPHRFSKIGDCQNVSSYFLSPFEHPSVYRLGEYENLQETVDWFNGSFSRDSLAVKGGFNVAAVLSPLRADSKQCEDGESPAACELRVFNPAFAVISMETWWSGKPENYEKYMRQLIEFLIDQGVVPILATKADNLEGGNQINQVLGQLAWEYDIPIWNFWASVQHLPNKGLTKDGFHLTLGNYFYDDLQSTKTGWSMRNLTALQAIDAVWRGVTYLPLQP